METTTTTPAAVIDTTHAPPTPAALPIVIKIGMPKEVEKQKIDKSKVGEDNDTKKPTKSRLCQLLPVLLFVVTFATVLSLLIVYHDPSSEYKIPHSIFFASIMMVRLMVRGAHLISASIC